MDVRRWAPLAGIVFVALVIVVVLVGGDTPDSDASGAKVISYYSDHNGAQFVASFLLAAAAAFLSIFGATLGSRVATDTRDVWERLLLVGTAVAATTIVLTAFVHFALTDAADSDVSASAARTLNFLDGDIWVAFNAGLGIMMLGFAAALLAARAPLPRWLAWVALAAGIALFIPYADFFALLVTLLWILVASVLLFRRGGAPAARAVAET